MCRRAVVGTKDDNLSADNFELQPDSILLAHHTMCQPVDLLGREISGVFVQRFHNADNIAAAEHVFVHLAEVLLADKVVCALYAAEPVAAAAAARGGIARNPYDNRNGHHRQKPD